MLMISLVSLLTYLGENIVYNFRNNLIEESKDWSGMMKKLFNKELVMIKEDNEDFKNSINVGSATKIMLIMMLK